MDLFQTHRRQAAACFLLAGMAVVSSLAVGQQPCVGQESPAVVLPCHVLQQVQFMHAELDLIRVEMGRPANHQPELLVADVAPREVLFQAQTLFRKSDRLAKHFTNSSIDEPATLSVEQTRPADVLRVVTAALLCLKEAKSSLQIPQLSPLPALPAENATPTDCFRAIVQANRQLNLLLDDQFAPSDCFRQVRRASGLTTRLLMRCSPDRISLPEVAWVRGKTPREVYGRLIDCYQIIKSIADASQISMLTLDVEQQHDQIAPSDVYDIASILVAEMAYLDKLAGGTGQPVGTHYSGRRFPSHVYQEAELLRLQLLQFKQLTHERPAWRTQPDPLSEGSFQP